MSIKTKTTSLLKRIGLSALFPVAMFLVMVLVTVTNENAYVNGKYIYLGSDLINTVVLGTCLSVSISLAIRLQLKNGRFDFSLGASIALTGIIAGNIGLMTGSPVIALISAVVIAVILSTVIGLVYVIGRVPIVITSIGMTLLYESITYLIFDGTGIFGFYSQEKLSFFGRIPLIFIPVALAVLLYILFNEVLTIGYKSKMLANNQHAAINVGINETRNVILTYVFNGLIIGLAAIIYVSQNEIPPQSNLSTASIMFSYIVPVYMGIIIGSVSKDYIGIIMAAIAMQFLYYGLDTINLGDGGIERIIMGMFVFGFYAVSAQSFRVRQFVQKLKKNKTANTTTN
ncbi:ABC transporter permease [Paracholeplasma manati]|uniref:Uncharacterized protein n=1 Tax=Paracholeplasma manati TaxID=591373 RepID=A0ABT2Y3F0_9MOLU|nr:hypothetical protein [Paracholeplasma manati]MCV2231264.1 hypothetical protein [Paracholeplasma manati]MDG0888342.1 hypothetical protein [Paracholeplasma manati]